MEIGGLQLKYEHTFDVGQNQCLIGFLFTLCTKQQVKIDFIGPALVYCFHVLFMK